MEKKTKQKPTSVEKIVLEWLKGIKDNTEVEVFKSKTKLVFTLHPPTQL
jgi:hypothetical protein